MEGKNLKKRDSGQLKIDFQNETILVSKELPIVTNSSARIIQLNSRNSGSRVIDFSKTVIETTKSF